MYINKFFTPVLLIILMFFVAGCEKYFIFHPEKDVASTPKDINIAYESVFFTTEDSVKISAWMVPSPNERATVIFCHGNAGNISHRLNTVRILHQLELSVLIFDYRGYGNSEGSPSVEGTYKDVDAAYKYLTIEKKVDPKRIIAWGRSLGGAVAAWLVRNKEARLLVLESTFTSAADIAEDFMPAAPTSLVFGDSYNTKGIIKDIKCPALIIHSPRDDIIPFKHGKKLFELANEPKEFLEISGLHNRGFIKSIKYKPGINAFLEKYGDVN